MKLARVAMLTAVVFGTVSVQNCRGWDGGFPYAPPYWGPTCSYSSYGSESVPYFALHPPVYYSHHVARTYGYSPFAYPSYVMTPGSEPSAGAMDQRYYRSAQPAPEPLMIVNPFVEPLDEDASMTRRQKPAPQVIYPAALTKQST